MPVGAQGEPSRAAGQFQGDRGGRHVGQRAQPRARAKAAQNKNCATPRRAQALCRVASLDISLRGKHSEARLTVGRMMTTLATHKFGSAAPRRAEPGLPQAAPKRTKAHLQSLAPRP